MLQLARGEALEVIVAALEHLGYKWAYRVVDSRAFGVPQRRQRVVLVASLEGDPRAVLLTDDEGEPEPSDSFPDVPCGFYWTEGVRGLGWAINAVPTLKGGSTIGIASPPAIIFPDGRVGTPDIRDAERMQGFEPDWTTPALATTRKGHRWKLIGNAVTVDLFEWLGQRLVEPGEFEEPEDIAPITGGRAWPHVGWNVGEGRFTTQFSAFPVRREAPALAQWLRHPVTPLSAKATAGFLSRARKGTLRFPKGFLESLDLHLALMERMRVAA